MESIADAPWKHQPKARELPSFPQYGKLFRGFSTLWKNIFHTVEKTAQFFHTMEKLFAVFPHNGKNVSTVWKTRFSGCFQGFSDCSPGLLSGARGAPYRYSRVMDRRGGEPREAPRTRLFITLGRRRFGLNGGGRYISTKEETRVARLRTGAPSTKWMSQDFRAGTMRQRSKRILQRWAASRPPL